MGVKRGQYFPSAPGALNGPLDSLHLSLELVFSLGTFREVTRGNKRSVINMAALEKGKSRQHQRKYMAGVWSFEGCDLKDRKWCHVRADVKLC